MTYISRSSDFALYLEDYLMYVHHTFGVWIGMTSNVGHWPIFHGPVIVPYTLTISWMNIISDYESVWPDAWPENKLGHCDLYFMVQWFCYILKTIWCMNIILGDYGSVWPDVWPQNKEMAPARGILAPLGTCSSVNQNWSKHPWRLRRVLLVAAPPYTHIYGVRPRTAWPGVVLKWLSIGMVLSDAAL